MHNISTMLMMAASASVAVTRQAGGTETANISAATSFTTAALAIGDVQASRFVVVALSVGRSNGLSPQDCTVTAVTIGGVTATKLAGNSGQEPGTKPWTDLSLWGAALPTGTTAAVAVTTNRTITAYCAAIEAVYDALATPAYTASAFAGPDVPITGVARGLVLSCGVGGGGIRGPSMTGVADFNSGAPEYVPLTTAFNLPTSTGTVNTISSYTGYIQTVAVSFAPM